MRRVLAIWLVLCSVALGLHIAHESATAGSMALLGAGRLPVASGSGCSQAATFIARTSGLSAGTQTNVTTLICAWVSNGTITGDLSSTGCSSNFEAIYLLGLTSTGNSRLNLCSTFFTITANGSPTWVTYGSGVGGYTGTSASTTIYLDTGLDISTSSIFTQNCAHFSVWNNSNSTSAGFDIMMGQGYNGTENSIFAKASDGNFYSRVNNVAGAGFTTFAITDPRGLLLVNRTGASAIDAYQNTTQSATASPSSSARTAGNMYILATNNGITADVGDNKQAMAASIGACLNGTQVTNFYTPLHTFLTAEAGIAY